MLTEENLYLEEVYSGGAAAGRMPMPAQTAAAHCAVFAEALLENSTTRQRRSPMDWAVSFIVHFSLLALLIFLPLFFSQGLDMKRLQTTLLIAPMPPMAPAPPAPPSIAKAPRVVPKVFTPGKLTAPTFIPKAVPVATNDAAPPEVSMTAGMGAVPGGVPGGQIGGITVGLGAVAAPVVATPAAEGPKQPVRIGGNVKQPKLIYGPAAVYPVLAAQGHIHGLVVIEAIIDEHGNVVQEKVVSGHPLLVQAAMKAVSQRKYEPTILDGEPTPVDLRVEVNFQM
jgi:protein TonB